MNQNYRYMIYKSRDIFYCIQNIISAMSIFLSLKTNQYNKQDRKIIREWLTAMYELCDINKDKCFPKITACCNTMNIKFNISLDDFYDNISTYV